MPGSGKSTIGKRLARHYGLTFIDGDTLIESAAGLPIQQVVNNQGLKRFSQLEQRVLCDIDPCGAVISTGGSAVYSADAMRHLQQLSTVIYLQISLQTLVQRVNNTNSRGLYKLPAHPLVRLYRERESLYPSYAHLTFNNDAPFTAIKASQLLQKLDRFAAKKT